MNSTNSTSAILFSLNLAPRSMLEVIFETIAVIVIITISVIGNGLILYIVYDGGLNKSSNIFMVNLAITDMMSSLMSLSLLLVTIATGRWILGDAMCQFQAYCSYALYCCTLCSLMVVSVNRYSLLCKTHIYRKFFGKRGTVVIVIVIWVTSFSFAAPPMFGWSRYVFLSDYAICVTDPSASPSFNTFLFMFLLVNMSIITVCYVRIFATLKNIIKPKKIDPEVTANQEVRPPASNPGNGETSPANQELRPLEANPVSGEAFAANGKPDNKEQITGNSTTQTNTSRSKEIEVTWIIFLIICLFAFCYLPTFIVGFFVFSSSPITRSMRLFSTFSISLTSVVNPLVFSIKSKAFRKLVKQVYRRIIGCCKN